jgi:hypothetical protein
MARNSSKGRGARQRHKRLLYYFNVNRTSQDHLLLGGNADVDKNVEWSEYSAGSGKFQGCVARENVRATAWEADGF